jgi:hypothetical protein
MLMRHPQKPFGQLWPKRPPPGVAPFDGTSANGGRLEVLGEKEILFRLLAPPRGALVFEMRALPPF